EAAENKRLQDLEDLAEKHDIEVKSIKKAHRADLLKLKKILEADLEKLQDEYEITEAELNNASEDNEELITELKDKIVGIKEKIAEQAALIEELNLLLGNRGYEYTEDGDVVYTVTRGDTLAIICTKCGVDYWKNRDDILEINGLDNENQIMVGQILKIPGWSFD
ncbi:MAG: LysM peptidoglycan-binding domain-containing protein, partial [Treponema sp.]|nr:LysM peptidoglycan-binding domain-containing protein [Treponema sp.]